MHCIHLNVWVHELACACGARSRALGIRSLADHLTPLRQRLPLTRSLLFLLGCLASGPRDLPVSASLR